MAQTPMKTRRNATDAAPAQPAKADRPTQKLATTSDVLCVIWHLCLTAVHFRVREVKPGDLEGRDGELDRIARTPCGDRGQASRRVRIPGGRTLQLPQDLPGRGLERAGRQAHSQALRLPQRREDLARGELRQAAPARIARA